MRYLTTTLFYLLIAFALQAQAPNVLLIIVDDQGYGDLSCHGNPDLPTPNLDELHRISSRLTDFHVSPTCSPTRAALMTGHVSNRTGVWHTIAGRSLLYEDETTLGDVFLKNGYATGMFGKWHLGDNHPFRPMDNGFEHAVYHGGGGVFQGPDLWGNDYFDDRYFVNGKEEIFSGYCTDVWFTEAMDFMEKKRREDKPFFTYLATNSPHGPFWVEHTYSAPFANNPRVPNANFHGMIANLDENVGRMMAYLDRSGLRENTLVIFMTDNGTARGAELDKVSGLATKGFNAGMRGLKNSRYEGGHRVPFFISWPKGGIEEGRNIDELTAHVDVLPTLIDMLGLKGAESLTFDGTSLKEILLNKEARLEKRTLITDTQRQENLEKWRMCAVMQDKWRLINGEELYDLKTDPGQQKDISKRHPKKVAELRSEYEKWWASLNESANRMATISLCHEDEPTLIYVHDMHMDKGYNSVAWNQRMIREGFKSEGWFAVEALEPGRYKFSLYRWVPELEVPIQAGIPPQPGVKGTSVNTLRAGKALPIQKAGITIDGKEMESEVAANDVSKSFEVELEKGKHQLRSWFKEAEGNAYGAFYILVEKV